MDVLEYWKPHIDWTRFSQGGVENDTWALFRELIALCHCFKHWRLAERNYTPLSRPLYTESAYKRGKRKREDRLQRSRQDGHAMRSAFLAAERVFAIAGKGSVRMGSADCTLSIAIFECLGTAVLQNAVTGHERTPFDLLALDEFDGAKELSDDPATIGKRWRERAR